MGSFTLEETSFKEKELASLERTQKINDHPRKRKSGLAADEVLIENLIVL